jgi:flagellar biosynthesis/type III secretory pathway protein FliH
MSPVPQHLCGEAGCRKKGARDAPYEVKVVALFKHDKVVDEGGNNKAGAPSRKQGLYKTGSYSTFTPQEVQDEEPPPEAISDEAPPLEEDLSPPPPAPAHAPGVAHPQSPSPASGSMGATRLMKDDETPPIMEEAVAEPVPPPPPAPQVDRMIIEEAEKKSEEIIRKARAEAKKLIEETKLYSQSAFAQAERDGFVKGKEDGFEAGREEMSSLIKEAKSVMEQTLRERELLFRSVEPEVAKLAIRIAEKIIQTQVEINEDIVINMIRSALDKVKQREEVTIKVNQADADYVKSKKDIFARMIEGLKTMDIIVDAGVERGGCIIETNLGNVDTRISTQIHTLELAFEKADTKTDEPAEGA